jgi:hypothetical protein
VPLLGSSFDSSKKRLPISAPPLTLILSDWSHCER